MDRIVDILFRVWLDVVKAVIELKFDITVTMTGGHSINVKFFKDKLCDEFMKMWVPNPLFPGNRVTIYYLIHLICSKTFTII